MNSLPTLDEFLACPTPKAWLERAEQEPEILLIDHANCEKKAAATANNMLQRYVGYPELLDKMSPLAREELLHFEKVLSLMRERQVEYISLTPGRYAQALNKATRKAEPERLIDRLIIGAFIEARSCERFHALIPYVDESLGRFYKTLFAAEKRHFQDYLKLAYRYAKEDIAARIEFFATLEADLINSPDPEFRFHSGLPV